jgi:hypothetical protein
MIDWQSAPRSWQKAPVLWRGRMETHEGLHLIATLVALRVQRFTSLSCLKVDNVRAGAPVTSSKKAPFW